MTRSKSKPTCLLIGTSAEKSHLLEKLLRSQVTFVIATPEDCISVARAKGARIAVFSWSQGLDEHSHQLTKSVPGIQVIVERSTHALRSRPERNGFAAIHYREQGVENLAKRIQSLIEPASTLPQPDQRNRASDVAAQFLRHLPSIQANLEEFQKLSEQLLQGLRTATGSTRGAVFHSAGDGEPFNLTASSHAGRTAGSMTVNLDSEIVAFLSEAGTIVHRQDDDLPFPIVNYLDEVGCDTIIPVLCDDGLAAWFMLRIGKPVENLQQEMLQSIAFFSSESFRVHRVMRQQLLRQSYLEAGLELASEAILIVDGRGKISHLFDRGDNFHFRGSEKKTYRDLNCGILKNAIRKCLHADSESTNRTIKDSGNHSISLSRACGGHLVVLFHSGIQNKSAMLIDQNIWDEIATWVRHDFLPAKSSAGDGMTLVPLSFLSKAPDESSVVKVIVPESLRRITVPHNAFVAIESFVRGLIHPTTKALRMAYAPEDRRVIRILCEVDPSSGEVNLLTHLGKSVLQLMALGITVRKEHAAFGQRWTLALNELQIGSSEPHQRYSSEQIVSQKEDLVLPSLAPSDTNGKSEYGQRASITCAHQQEPAGSNGRTHRSKGQG